MDVAQWQADALSRMEPDDTFYFDNWLSLYQGDARTILRSLRPQSVHAVVTSPPYYGLRSYLPKDHPDKELELGREQTPAEYIDALLEVFEGIWHVLRDDGSVWLNLGDSYANDGKWGGSTSGKHVSSLHGNTGAGRGKRITGLKPKELVGIPWRVAFALQEAGWYLRSDVIWSKPNPMPSPVQDRPSMSHEYVFLLTKSERYFYDINAIREPHKPITLERIKHGLNQQHPHGLGVGVPPVRTTQIDGAESFDTATVTKGAMGERFAHPLGRNRRTVWEVPTLSYPGAHYAVFPPNLIKPMIQASTPEGGVCAECGAPSERELVKGIDILTGDEDSTLHTVGWNPTCDHDHAPVLVPATVLDPFAGTGTVGMVAQSLSRRAVLVDLNLEYLAQQLTRNSQVPMGL